MKDIDDYIDELIADMDLDELVVWANNLEIEVNYPPVDDMWPDWENELAVSVGEALLQNLSLKKYNQLQAEVERLKEALKMYGRHGRTDNSPMCEKSKHSDYPCTCGFDQALTPKDG